MSPRERQFQAEKMDALARLAATVAHEFNNQLMAIMGYCEIAASSLDPEAPLRADLRQIREVVLRAAALAGQLLAVGRRPALRLRQLNLNEFLREAEPKLTALLAPGVELGLSLGARVPDIRIGPGRLFDLLATLVRNACDAMPGGGRIAISTSQTGLEPDSSRVWIPAPPGRYARLDFRDTGRGMEENVLRRLFEPYFAGKPRAPGAGLGLAAAHALLQAVGGTLAVESRPGAGALFELYFPSAGGQKL